MMEMKGYSPGQNPLEDALHNFWSDWMWEKFQKVLKAYVHC